MRAPPGLDAIRGVRLLRPEVHADRRGRFVEVFREDVLATRFVQANHSRSVAGALRGLHYHRRQADAWYVVRGTAQVALADLRARAPSPTAVTLELSGDDPAALLIPPGVAHGLLALTDVDLVYWVSAPYDGSDEFAVAWDDPTLAVPWRTTTAPVLSARDASAPGLDWDGVAAVPSPIEE